jgi:hypothetical protein
MTPQSFEQWLHCITLECGIKLTKDFVSLSLSELTDRANPHTAQIIEIYGAQHYSNLIN